jgi:hypothetical protein
MNSNGDACDLRYANGANISNLMSASGKSEQGFTAPHKLKINELMNATNNGIIVASTNPKPISIINRQLQFQNNSLFLFFI